MNLSQFPFFFQGNIEVITCTIADHCSNQDARVFLEGKFFLKPAFFFNVFCKFGIFTNVYGFWFAQLISKNFIEFMSQYFPLYPSERKCVRKTIFLNIFY